MKVFTPFSHRFAVRQPLPKGSHVQNAGLESDPLQPNIAHKSHVRNGCSAPGLLQTTIWRRFGSEGRMLHGRVNEEVSAMTLSPLFSKDTKPYAPYCHTESAGYARVICLVLCRTFVLCCSPGLVLWCLPVLRLLKLQFRDLAHSRAKDGSLQLFPPTFLFKKLRS